MEEVLVVLDRLEDREGRGYLVVLVGLEGLVVLVGLEGLVGGTTQRRR